MKITTFLKKKNKIIEKYIGLTLVPNKQIYDIPDYKEKLNELDHTGRLGTDNDALMCPYCVYYNTINNDKYCDTEMECTGCPMYENGNWCNDPHSTYRKVINKIGSHLSNTWDNEKYHKMIEEISDLVYKFNTKLDKHY